MDERQSSGTTVNCWLRRYRLLVLVVGLSAVAPMEAARAEEPPALLARLVGGDSFRARLISIDAMQRLTLQTAGGARRSVPLEDLLLWGHPTELVQGPVVVMRDGSLIRTVEVLVADGECAMDPESSDAPAVAVGDIRAVRFVPFEDRHGAMTGGERSWRPDARDDQVLLRNHDAFRGRITEVTADGVHLARRGRSLKIQRSRVAAAVFGAPAESSAAGGTGTRDLTLLVGLRDGSLLRVRELAFANSAFAARLVQGATLRGISVDDLWFLQPLGHRVVYLSDLHAVDYTYRPYWGIDWPLRADRNVWGGRLRTSSGMAAKGLGMRSGSTVTYEVSPQDGRFEAELALDERCGARGSVRFYVELWKENRWLRAYESDILRGGMESKTVAVALEGATAIRLRVDSADHGDAWDIANWLNARFVR